MNEMIMEMRNGAMILTFNRPDKGNAMTLDMATQLFNALKAATTDRSVRAVLLRGKGGNFMDGVDMNMYMLDPAAAMEKANQLILPYHSAIREMQVMDKPVLAAVDGAVTGAGLSLMMASDLVLAAKSARFNCKFSTYALTPDGGCSFFLPRKAGATKALELLMLSEDFTAEQAKQWNLINNVTEDDKLHAEADAWIDQLATGPTRSLGAIKKMVTKAFENDINDHLGLEHTYLGASWRTFDFRAAMKAYFGKTEVKFTGT